MYLKNLFAVSAAITSTAAAPYSSTASAPYSIPTTDGFPNPNPQQLAAIEELAGGTLPNTPLPTILKPAGVTTLQLIATNEIFEVAYFSELLYNVTNNVHGYRPGDLGTLDRDYVIKSLKTIIAQEKLHALGANGLLKSGGQATLGPCKYAFPVKDFLSAVTLANTFTDVVLGTLQDAQVAFATDAGDETGLVPFFGSIIGNEAEQNGFYRFVQKKKPSAAPFLTGSKAAFAFTAIQNFIVPNSCPTPLSDIDLPTFKPLNVLTTAEAKNMTLAFEVKGKLDCKGNSVVYLSGQNLPVTASISEPKYDKKGNAVFEAEFPFEGATPDDRFSNGLTIAAVVKGTGKFSTYADVVAATLFGPGLIEVM